MQTVLAMQCASSAALASILLNCPPVWAYITGTSSPAPLVTIYSWQSVRTAQELRQIQFALHPSADPSLNSTTALQIYATEFVGVYLSNYTASSGTLLVNRTGAALVATLVNNIGTDAVIKTLIPANCSYTLGIGAQPAYVPPAVVTSEGALPAGGRGVALLLLAAAAAAAAL